MEKRNASITGWNTNAYAEKLMSLANIVTIENEKGEIIGLIAAYLNRSDFGFISMLIVMPEYRRCRAAEALCEKVHMLAREKNIPSIRGEIRKENMACRRLAEMLGMWSIRIPGMDLWEWRKLSGNDFIQSIAEENW